MTMTSKLIEEGENYILHTYNRNQIVLDKGEGVYLYDVEGKKYLDFASGIGVYALGYGNEEYNNVLKGQVDKLLHTSNLYYNVPAIEAAKKLVKASGLSKVFFTNSGTEAIEGVIKAAKKYAYLRDNSADHEIIAMNHSFHGRSIGALSVTGNAHYQEPFKPLLAGIKFADFNDIDSVTAQITDKTCAILLEPVQGEGGIYPAEKEFLQKLRQICDEKDILLIFDEIQCGMGRTGDIFAYKKFGVMPDAACMAKALGCGVPVGAFVLGEKMAKSSLVPGDHGTTYGGNPFACAAVSAVFDIFEKNDVMANVNEMAEYMKGRFEELVSKYDFLEAHRGEGLMRGIVVKADVPAGSITGKALEKGLIIITAGGNVLRFLPPLVITKEQIDEGLAILEEVFEEIK